MYKVYFTEAGEKVAAGRNIMLSDEYFAFEVDENIAYKVIPVLDNGVIVGIDYDESIIIDPDTSEPVPTGETLAEQLARVKAENEELNKRVSTMQDDNLFIMEILAANGLA